MGLPTPAVGGTVSTPVSPTSREYQRCFRAEGDSELRATITLQREWRKMAARVSEWMDDRVGVLVSGWVIK